MTIKQTHDGSAAVNTDFLWISVEELKPPQGTKLLLINRRQGVAVLGQYKPDCGFTHWQALPKFPENK